MSYRSSKLLVKTGRRQSWPLSALAKPMLWLPLEQMGKEGKTAEGSCSVCVLLTAQQTWYPILRNRERLKERALGLKTFILLSPVSSPHWVWEGLRAQIWSVARAPENVGAGGLAPLTPSHIVSPMAE